MSTSLHRAPSVGSVVKKLMAINPDLGAQQLMEIIRKSVRVQGSTAGEFASAEVIDEAKAVELAQNEGCFQ